MSVKASVKPVHRMWIYIVLDHVILDPWFVIYASGVVSLNVPFQISSIFVAVSVFLGKCAKSRPAFFAERLYKSMKVSWMLHLNVIQLCLHPAVTKLLSSMFLRHLTFGEWLSSFEALLWNCKLADSNPTERLTGLTDPTSIRGFWLHSKQKWYKAQWLTSDIEAVSSVVTQRGPWTSQVVCKKYKRDKFASSEEFAEWKSFNNHLYSFLTSFSLKKFSFRTTWGNLVYLKWFGVWCFQLSFLAKINIFLRPWASQATKPNSSSMSWGELHIDFLTQCIILTVVGEVGYH